MFDVHGTDVRRDGNASEFYAFEHTCLVNPFPSSPPPCHRSMPPHTSKSHIWHCVSRFSAGSYTAQRFAAVVVSAFRFKSAFMGSTNALAALRNRACARTQSACCGHCCGHCRPVPTTGMRAHAAWVRWIYHTSTSLLACLLALQRTEPGPFWVSGEAEGAGAQALPGHDGRDRIAQSERCCPRRAKPPAVRVLRHAYDSTLLKYSRCW